MNNPFIYGADATYLPEYSIHSPEQVNRLRQELIRAGDRLRTELARVKSKRLRSEAMANFEEELVEQSEGIDYSSCVEGLLGLLMHVSAPNHGFADGQAQGR